MAVRMRMRWRLGHRLRSSRSVLSLGSFAPAHSSTHATVLCRNEYKVVVVVVVVVAGLLPD
jgi:hypothetical protein